MTDQLQRIMDGLNSAMRETRKDYHVKLGELARQLERVPEHYIVVIDFNNCSPGEAISYRGFYEDLAFVPVSEPKQVGEFLHEVVGLIDTQLTGYKGGEFFMDDETPLWISEYGEGSGIAVVDTKIRSGTLVLVTTDTRRKR